MQPRTMMIGALAASPLLGLLIGLTVNQGMAAPPEPAWRSASPDPIFTEKRAAADSDAVPQGLAAALAANRMPTWKRNPPERRAVAYAEEPAPEADPRVEYADPAFAEAADSRDAAADAATKVETPTITLAAPQAGI